MNSVAVPLSYTLSPNVNTSSAMPSNSVAVASSPVDEHDAMSPAPTRTTGGTAVGCGVGGTGVAVGGGAVGGIGVAVGGGAVGGFGVAVGGGGWAKVGATSVA